MRKPDRACAYPGCAAILQSEGSFCEKHREPQPSPSSQGYDRRWYFYSIAYRRKFPFCCDPFRRHPGHLRKSECVGHKLAHKGDQRLFWDPANHYALCISCNSYQSAKDEGGFGNRSAIDRKRDGEAASAGCGARGDSDAIQSSTTYDRNVYSVPPSPDETTAKAKR